MNILVIKEHGKITVIESWITSHVGVDNVSSIYTYHLRPHENNNHMHVFNNIMQRIRYNKRDTFKVVINK